MTTISFGDKTYKVATNWSELTADQYQQLIMCPRLNNPEGRVFENESKACMVWLGMSPRVWNSLQLATWQWLQLRKEFAWLFETTPIGKPPINVFIHKGVNYHLPAANFENTTALELAYANMAYVEFAQQEQDVDVESKRNALDRLIATLCRPRREDLRKFQKSKDWNGDVREEFNEHRMLSHAQKLATMDLQIKLLILDYFERTNNEFLHSYGELFGGGREPRYGDGRGWIMLLKNVAKDGHFGNFDQVCQQPAHLLFASLLDDMLDSKEQAQNTPPNENH